MKTKTKPKGKKMVAISATAHEILKKICKNSGKNVGRTVEMWIELAEKESEKCQTN